MANKFRGETEVEIGGVKYLLRASFEGLLEMEDKAGCGIMEMVDSVSRGRITSKQAIAIIYGGIIGGGVKIDFNELGEACVQEGMLSCSAKAAIFLGQIVKARQKKTQDESSQDQK